MTAKGADSDVLVVGGGIAALCAAISARRSGASVLMIEQAPRELRGGNSRHSRNIRVMHEAPSPSIPGSYGEEEFQAGLWKASEGACDEALGRLLIRNSADLPDWLAANGVIFQTANIPYSRKTAFFLGGGKAAVNALYATAQSLGVRICYGTEVTALRLDGGADILGKNGKENIRARAVIACCGGYQANRDWLRREWGEAGAAFINRGTPFANGGVLRSLLQQGVASAGRPGACHLVAVDARSPSHDGGIVTRVDGMEFGIVVNRDGRRFHDEAAETGPTRYRAWGRLVAGCPDQSATLILDAEGIRKVQPPVFLPIQAPAIGDLARTLKIDAENLTRSAAASGRLTAPPYFAFPMRPGVTFTCLGVKVDEKTRVAMPGFQVRKNLFAAGMIMAPNLLGAGYLAGAATTIGAVFGRIAGEEAALHALG